MPPRLRPRVPTIKMAGSYTLIWGERGRVRPRIQSLERRKARLSQDQGKRNRAKKIPCATYHALNGLVHLADRKLEHQTDGPIVGVLLDDLVEQLLSLAAVSTVLDARLAADLRVLLDDAQTDNLVAVVDELVDQPFERELGVVVLVGAAQEGARPARVLVVAMLAAQGQGEVAGVLVVEGVERDAILKGPGSRSGQHHRSRSVKREASLWRWARAHNGRPSIQDGGVRGGLGRAASSRSQIHPRLEPPRGGLPSETATHTHTRAHEHTSTRAGRTLSDVRPRDRTPHTMRQEGKWVYAAVLQDQALA